MFKQLLAMACATLLCASLGATELKPFNASYSANWKVLPFSGKAERSLKRSGNNWQLEFHASAVVASITETSNFAYSGQQITPLGYSLKRSGLGKSKHNQQQYDHATDRLTWQQLKQTPQQAAIVPQALDQFSAQFALQLDVARGLKEMSYLVQEGSQIEEYRFRVLGTETITTAAGKLQATRVERVRDGNKKRQTHLWFANDWDFLLVQLLQVESDGKEYVINLKQGKVDGKKVRGL